MSPRGTRCKVLLRGSNDAAMAHVAANCCRFLNKSPLPRSLKIDCTSLRSSHSWTPKRHALNQAWTPGFQSWTMTPFWGTGLALAACRSWSSDGPVLGSWCPEGTGVFQAIKFGFRLRRNRCIPSGVLMKLLPELWQSCSYRRRIEQQPGGLPTLFGWVTELVLTLELRRLAWLTKNPRARLM